MNQETPVIVEEKAFDQAYDMGFSRFSQYDISSKDFDFEPFTQSGTYAENILPKLRALAGFGDSGYGTYQESRDIVIISEADLDDIPISGELTESDYLVDELIDEFRKGAYEAVENQLTV